MSELHTEYKLEVVLSMTLTGDVGWQTDEVLRHLEYVLANCKLMENVEDVQSEYTITPVGRLDSEDD